MIKLAQSLAAWNTDHFKQVVKQEIESLNSDTLPLYKCTQSGGMVDDTNISAIIIQSDEKDEYIQVKASIFFNEIIGGCNCHDDPVSTNVCCEMLVSIDKQTAEAIFTPVQ